MRKFIIGILLLFPVCKIDASNDTLYTSNDSISKEIILDSVIVKSKYKYAKRSGNKYVISFKGSPFYKNKSLAEALTISPLITKENNSFKVLGKSSTVIYINGRPSMLSGDDLYSLLDSKRVEDIDHIEILSNPSVKYGADLQSAIINIIVSEKVEPGFMSITSAEIIQGKKLGVRGTELLAYNLRNISINLFLNGMHARKSTVSQRNYQYQLGDVDDFEEKTILSKKGTPYSLLYSLNWKTESMELDFDYSLSNSRIDDAGNQLLNGTHILDKNEKLRNLNHNFQLFNSYKFNKTTIGLLYNLYFRKNRDNSDFISTDDYIRQRDIDKYVHNALKIDFNSRVDSSLIFEYGVNGNIQNVKTDYEYSDFSNSAKFREHTLGAYFTGQKQLDKWSLYLGVRYEYTMQKYLENSETYSNLLPTISVSYDLPSASFYFEYARSIERLPYSNLIVTPSYFSPNSLTIGNPNLQPTIFNDLQLGVNYSNLEAELFTKLISDGILEYSYLDNGINVTSYTNIDRENQIGMTLSYMRQMNRHILIKLSGSSYYDVTKLGDGTTQKSWNNYLSTNMSIMFDRSGIFDANVNYWALFPQKESGLYWRNRGNFSLRINCNLLNKRLKLSLEANDIFNQDMARYQRVYNDVTVDTKNTFDKRNISFSVKYMFGNNKPVKKNKHRNISDLNRIPIE